MTIFDKNYYGKFVSGGYFSALDSLALTANGCDRQWQCHICMTDVDYIIAIFKMCEVAYREKKEVNFLCCVSYLTYIPYGDTGYDVAEKLIRAQTKYESLADYRYERILEIMKHELSDMSEGEKSALKSFFVDYRKDTFDLTDKVDVTRLFCRGLSKLEAWYDLSSSFDMRKESKKFFDRVLEIYNEKTNNGTQPIDNEDRLINSEELFNLHKEKGALSDRELAFLRECIGL